MTFSKTLTFIAGLSILASCTSPASDGCAGWRPVHVSDATARAMAVDDPQALRALIAHHEFGASQGCWK